MCVCVCVCVCVYKGVCVCVCVPSYLSVFSLVENNRYNLRSKNTILFIIPAVKT